MAESISPQLVARWTLLKEVFNRRWPRRFILAWAALGSWDLFVSQFCSEETAKKFPKAYQVIEMTTGWLTWQQWSVLGLLLVVIFSVEYAFRLRQKHQFAAGRKKPDSPDPIATPIPTRRLTDDYEASLKLPIIKEAIDILNHNAVFEQPIDDAGRLQNALLSELKAGRHEQLLIKLEELRKRFVENNQRIGALYVRTENIHDDIAKILVQPYSESLMTGIYGLSDAIKKLDNPVPSNFDLWLKPQIEKFHEGIVSVGRWRGTALFALFDLRRKLIA